MAFLSKSVSFQKSRALIYIPCINYNLMDDCILGGWLAIPWDPRVDWRFSSISEKNSRHFSRRSRWHALFSYRMAHF
jgi:hypothetical protein